MTYKLLWTVPVISLASLIGACSHAPDAHATTAPVKIEEAPDTDIIKVEHPERFPLVSVQTRARASELQTNGVVSPDISRAIPVNALVSGRVVEVKARLGDTVKAGQILLTINSPELAMSFAGYQKFQADEALAKKDLARKQLLYSRGAIAQKDLEASEDAAQKAQVDVKTSADRIRILGGDPNHIASMFEVRAPASGTITEQNVTAAAGVKSPDSSPNLFTISDLSHVWLLCDVYENNLAQVRHGDSARVQLNAYPDRALSGRISNISRVLDPATRTAKVRLDMDNRAGLLRPGMFATVTFYSQSQQQREIIPASAVLRLHDKDWVFRPDGEKRFRRVEIHAGASLAGGYQEVISGLSPGDRVVANALQLSSLADQT